MEQKEILFYNPYHIQQKIVIGNFFQLDKYHETFPANCLVEALMIGGEGSTAVGTNVYGI